MTMYHCMIEQLLFVRVFELNVVDDLFTIINFRV